IVFPAPANGVYRVIATTFGFGVGPYTLVIQHGAPFGFGFGHPRPIRIPGKRPILVPGMVGGAVPVQEIPQANDKKEDEKKEPQFNLSDIADLGSKQSNVRVAAFNNLAGSVPKDLAPRHAQKIARYLLVTIQQKSELEDVTAKLEA